MSRYSVTPTIITFNSLIDACARAGDIDRARSIFAHLREAGLKPNDRTFSAMIHSHAVLGQVRKCSYWQMGLEDGVSRSVLFGMLECLCDSRQSVPPVISMRGVSN